MQTWIMDHRFEDQKLTKKQNHSFKKRTYLPKLLHLIHAVLSCFFKSASFDCVKI